MTNNTNTFNEKNVIEALGAGSPLETKTYSTGNVQVFFNRESLSKSNGYQICSYLKEASDRLTKAGIPNEVQLSFNTGKRDADGKPIYKPNPQVWCNQPDETQRSIAQTTDQVAALTANVSELKGMFTAFVSQLSNAQPGAVAPAAPAPAAAPAVEQPVAETALPPTTDVKPW